MPGPQLAAAERRLRRGGGGWGWCLLRCRLWRMMVSAAAAEAAGGGSSHECAIIDQSTASNASPRGAVMRHSRHNNTTAGPHGRPNILSPGCRRLKRRSPRRVIVQRAPPRRRARSVRRRPGSGPVLFVPATQNESATIATDGSRIILITARTRPNGSIRLLHSTVGRLRTAAPPPMPLARTRGAARQLGGAEALATRQDGDTATLAATRRRR